MIGRIILLIFLTWSLTAQAEVKVKDLSEAKPLPKTGEKAARKFFKAKRQSQIQRSPAQSASSHYLALHFGHFLNSTAYRWGGASKAEDPGELSIGVTYRIGEWTNSMDLLFRGDFNAFELQEGKAVKMSLLPMITFPDASSRFPLYFGGGLGLGIYLSQISNESHISMDYQLVTGVRFFDVLETIGFTLEFGLKNHIHLLSNGQFNGIFLSGGAVFSF